VRGVLPEDPQVRRLALATAVNTVGAGLYISISAIFLVRSVGLSADQVGTGLTLGALVGLGVGPIIGDQADRRGAREVLVACMLLEALASVSLLVVHDVLTLSLSTAAAAVSGAGSHSARGALIGLVGGENGARVRTYLRAVTNVGLAVGTLGAAVVLAIDTRPAYVAMILGNTLTCLLALAVIAGIGHLPPTRRARTEQADRTTRWVALRDIRYLVLTTTTSIASIQYSVFIYALPLWVTEHTSAPRWIASVLFFLACVVVAAIQVPATRSIDGPATAARLIALSGPLFLLAWILWTFASGAGTTAAVALLVVGVLIHCVAEVWQAGGAFELSFALARSEAQGQYQGVFGVGHQIIEAIAPFVVIALCITWGTPGWIALALVVTLSGLIGALAVRMRGRVRKGSL